VLFFPFVITRLITWLTSFELCTGSGANSRG
jgi:hypothetical protein